MKHSALADTAGVQDWRMRRVLAYHEFSCIRSRDVYQLQPEIFRAQLNALQAATPFGARCEITFDDAHRSQVELAAPILEETGTRGVFFAPAGWIGECAETATWIQLRALVRSGHTVGSHGQTHTLLTHCTSTQLSQELSRSRRTLEDGLGLPVHAIAMPGGRWNATVATACLAAGYRELYSSEPGFALQWACKDREDCLAIVGRLGVRRTMTLRTVVGYGVGNRFVTARLQAEYTVKQALKRLVGDTTYQRLWRGLLRSSSKIAS